MTPLAQTPAQNSHMPLSSPLFSCLSDGGSSWAGCIRELPQVVVREAACTATPGIARDCNDRGGQWTCNHQWAPQIEPFHFDHHSINNQGQPGGLASKVLAAKPDDLNLIPRSYTVGEKQLPQVVLWAPHMYHGPLIPNTPNNGNVKC